MSSAAKATSTTRTAATVTESARRPVRAPIVVALKAARRCGETLEMAAALAAATGTDLEVVLVEDANLLRLADLPVTKEVDRLSGATRDIDRGSMQRALHSEARELRTKLARLGRASAVRSTVRVVRGQILGEALAASARVDITFMHGAQRMLPGESLRRGTAMATRGAGVPRRGRRPVLTLFKGGPEGVRTLRVAATLARAIGGGLTTLIPNPGDEGTERYKREAREAVEQADMRFVEGAEGRALMLGRMLVPGTGSLLVLAKHSPELDDAATRDYLEELAIPLVLVT